MVVIPGSGSENNFRLSEKLSISIASCGEARAEGVLVSTIAIL
jgi:hypothetical protein